MVAVFSYRFLTMANATRSNKDESLTKYMDGKFLKLEQSFRSELASLRLHFQELADAKNAEISELKSKNTILEEKFDNVRSELRELKSTVEENDQYERRDTIIIAGRNIPVCKPREDCHAAVIQLIRQNLNINLDIRDINTAHRFGTKLADKLDKRPFIVKLCRRDLKSDLIRASKRQESPQIFINEHLTPMRRNIFNAVRKMKKNHQDVKGCSTFEGKVFAFTRNNASPDAKDHRHLISNHECLNEFSLKFIKMPIESFLKQCQDRVFHTAGAASAAGGSGSV